MPNTSSHGQYTRQAATAAVGQKCAIMGRSLTAPAGRVVPYRAKLHEAYAVGLFLL